MRELPTPSGARSPGTAQPDALMTDKPRMKVYYNSACPVCKAGIEGQMEKGSSCEIQWADVHKDNALVSEVHAELEYVRERLHVVDERGELQVGFDAFLAIWRNSPTERWKASVMGLPVVKQVLRVLYNLFAAALYKWNRSKKHW
jgi:predicted DCC family thiol-disulfide oxidoreductase YuxK